MLEWRATAVGPVNHLVEEHSSQREERRQQRWSRRVLAMLEEQPGEAGSLQPSEEAASGEKGGLGSSQGLRAIAGFFVLMQQASVTCCVDGSSGLFRLGLSSSSRDHKSSRQMLVLKQPDFRGCTKAH